MNAMIADPFLLNASPVARLRLRTGCRKRKVAVPISRRRTVLLTDSSFVYHRSFARGSEVPRLDITSRRDYDVAMSLLIRP